MTSHSAEHHYSLNPRMPKPRRLPTRVILRAITDSPACQDCQAHRSDPDARDATHRRLWSALAERIDKCHKAKRAELEARIVEIEGQNEELRALVVSNYEADISPKLRELLQSDAVAEATRKRDGAYAREGQALSMLLPDIEPHHRGKRGKDSRCTCGQFSLECPEWQVLEPFRDELRLWENAQLRRMREGKPHGLPMRHPEVKKQYGSHFASDFRGLREDIVRRYSGRPSAATRRL